MVRWRIRKMHRAIKMWGKYLAWRREMVHSIEGLISGLQHEFEHERVATETMAVNGQMMLIQSARQVISLIRQAMLTWGMRAWVSVVREKRRVLEALRRASPMPGNPFRSQGIQHLDDLAVTAGWGEYDYFQALDNMRASRVANSPQRSVNISDVELTGTSRTRPVSPDLAHIQVARQDLLRELAPFLNPQSPPSGNHSPSNLPSQSPGFLRGYARGKNSRRAQSNLGILPDFEDLDVNGDGVIDRAEWEAMML